MVILACVSELGDSFIDNKDIVLYSLWVLILSNLPSVTFFL